MRDRQDAVTYVGILSNSETTDARLTHLKGSTHLMGPTSGVAIRSPNLLSPNYRGGELTENQTMGDVYPVHNPRSSVTRRR